ncbi:MAG: RNA polymerase sigma factor RpoH [Magnetovibrio sp.]|nr:RNA polymerase sigma factor RpoH [Magnetovibrio sp.]
MAQGKKSRPSVARTVKTAPSLTSIPGLGVSPDQNLSRYLQDIRKFPMLSFEDEQDLANRWVKHGDEQAAHKLVTSHLRLVAKIAMSNRGYGLPIADLIAEGNVGMIQAVNRFDPEKGFRISTYAMWWIRASIQEYVLHSWSMVKMGTTAAQKKLFFNLRRVKGQMKAYEEGDLSLEQVTLIAEQLGVPEYEVVNMNRRLSGGDSSLNASISMDGEGEWQDMLEDDRASQEDTLSDMQELVQRRKLLVGAMKGLSERECTILTERRLSETPKTLDTLSQSFGISRERVRQIEACAFEKLQKSVKNAVIELKIAH